MRSKDELTSLRHTLLKRLGICMEEESFALALSPDTFPLFREELRKTLKEELTTFIERIEKDMPQVGIKKLRKLRESLNRNADLVYVSLAKVNNKKYYVVLVIEFKKERLREPYQILVSAADAITFLTKRKDARAKAVIPIACEGIICKLAIKELKQVLQGLIDVVNRTNYKSKELKKIMKALENGEKMLFESLCPLDAFQ